MCSSGYGKQKSMGVKNDYLYVKEKIDVVGADGKTVQKEQVI